MTRPNPHLAFEELAKNGFTIVEVDGESLRAELVDDRQRDARMPRALPARSRLAFVSERFRVRAGTKTLERVQGAAVTRWDTETASWLPS